MAACSEKRILIDATGASIGGGYTYLVNVMPRLCAAAPGAQFRLLLRHEGLRKAIPMEPNLEILSLPPAGIAKRLRHVYWGIPRLAREWPADLYFSVSELSPYRLPCPAIASFRNANPFRPDLAPPTAREKVRIRALGAVARLSARRCDRIVFVSHDSAQWIGDSIALDPQKRAVIHHGIDSALWGNTPPYTGHPRPYLLSVGSIYFYKNYVRLIEAWTCLARSQPDLPDLIIIGDEWDADHRIAMEAVRKTAGPLAERISILGAVPYAEVQAYYKGASLFVFPSYLETFGHPVLEAMAADIPLVASDMPVFREIAGDAALYADPKSSDAIAESIRQGLEPETARTLVDRGRAKIKDFSWDATASKILALFEDTMARSGDTPA